MSNVQYSAFGVVAEQIKTLVATGLQDFNANVVTGFKQASGSANGALNHGLLGGTPNHATWTPQAGTSTATVTYGATQNTVTMSVAVAFTMLSHLSN